MAPHTPNVWSAPAQPWRFRDTPIGAWVTPDNEILIAQRAEALGSHSLWVFQRLF